MYAHAQWFRVPRLIADNQFHALETMFFCKGGSATHVLSPAHRSTT
jgi:hypothetical protein